MKQIYIIEMACPSWRGRADREELKTMKYNLERHRDFKANQSNFKVDVLEGYMNSVWSWRDFSGRVLYVCMFVFFGCGSARKLEFPRGFAAPENVLWFHRLLRVAATQLLLW